MTDPLPLFFSFSQRLFDLGNFEYDACLNILVPSRGTFLRRASHVSEPRDWGSINVVMPFARDDETGKCLSDLAYKSSINNLPHRFFAFPISKRSSRLLQLNLESSGASAELHPRG